MSSRQSPAKIAASALYYSGGLRLMNRFVNAFEPAGNQKRFPFIRRRSHNSFQVLTYHRIDDEGDPFFPATPISMFEGQMEYLARHFNVLPLDDLVDMAQERNVPKNAIAVTLDDGYRDNYLNAFPIFQRYAIPAVIYLATGFIGTGEIPWYDRISYAVKHTHQPSLTLAIDGPREHPLDTIDQKLTALYEVWELLKTLEEKERFLWIDRILQRLEVEDTSELCNQMLTWDQVREMHQQGISFGAHTVSHPILARLSTDRAREEVVESKRVIEEHLGTPVKGFAYPNGNPGDFDERVQNLLSEAGYVHAVTSFFGANRVDEELYELQRGGPCWEQHIPTFAMRLNWYKFIG